MRKILLIALPIILLISCCPQKKIQQVPVREIEKIEYRDSIIHVRDTIKIFLPIEEKEISTRRDSSHLETSIAKSDAWIDNSGNLNHTLKNKRDKPLETIRDTIFITNNVTEYKGKEVPVEVPVPEPYIPKIFWYITIYAAICATITIVKIIIKFKKII